MTTAPALLTKREAADLMRRSERSIDRYRQQYDLGEVHLTNSSAPLFRREVIEAGLRFGFNKKAKKK